MPSDTRQRAANSNARRTVSVSIGSWRGNAATDETGVGIVEYDGPGGPATVTAADKSGRSTTAKVNFGTGEGLLLRPDRAIYRCGETMKLEIFSTVRRGTAFIDMVRGGQTLLTMSAPVADGRAVHAFDIPQDLFGGMEVRAYVIQSNGDIVRDSRIVYVQPSEDLKIDVVPGKDVFEPGEDATIRFHVTEQGKDVRAALGVSIVDEAVFAIEEMRPGLEKVYFTLQEELLTPRFQIKIDALACMLFAEAEVRPAPAVSRRVVNTLEQRRRVMQPRLERWYDAFERHIVRRGHRFAVQENGSWKWVPGLFWEISQSPGVLDRDMWDAWGGRMTMAKLEQWDSRFAVAHWMERRKP